MTTPAADAGILIKRVFNASPDKVWRFWTSEAGLEQWWGPVGFVSRVSALDVRVGGGFDIVMRATAADVVAYLAGPRHPAGIPRARQLHRGRPAAAPGLAQPGRLRARRRALRGRGLDGPARARRRPPPR